MFGRIERFARTLFCIIEQHKKACSNNRKRQTTLEQKEDIMKLFAVETIIWPCETFFSALVDSSSLSKVGILAKQSIAAALEVPWKGGHL